MNFIHDLSLLDLEREGVPEKDTNGYLECTAEISPCGLYRYLLTRIWDYKKPGVLWIMLNPSTADGLQDDATIRRCVGYAKEWGAGSIWVVNLFAYRATKPPDLILFTSDPVGPDNDTWINKALDAHRGRADLILVGWGSHGSHKKLKGRRDQVLRQLPVEDTHCLDTTSTGDPKHPLRLASDLGPVQYEFPASAYEVLK